MEAEASGTPGTPFKWVTAKRESFDWSKVEGLWSRTSNKELVEKPGVSYGRVLIARNARIIRAKRGEESEALYLPVLKRIIKRPAHGCNAQLSPWSNMNFARINSPLKLR